MSEDKKMNLKLRKTILTTIILVGVFVVWAILFFAIGFVGLGLMDYDPNGVVQFFAAITLPMLIILIVLAVVVPIVLIIIWINYFKNENKS